MPARHSVSRSTSAAFAIGISYNLCPSSSVSNFTVHFLPQGLSVTSEALPTTTANRRPRFSWIRDSSFTLYALIRLGFTEEANSGYTCWLLCHADHIFTAYLEFIFERLRNKNADGSLQIMYTIHGKRLIYRPPVRAG